MSHSLRALVSVWQSTIPARGPKAGGVLVLLLLARVAIAQDVQALPASEKIPAAFPKISYVGGQLKIDALGATLGDVLTKVAALTGVNIEIPAGANSERMPVVELGPGPARQILASLLSDSNFDYLIQASDADPEKVKSVLLIPREKKGIGTNGTEVAARPSRSPYSRAAPQPEGPVAETLVPAQPENAAAEANALNPQPDQSTPTPPDQSMQLRLTQPDQSSLMKPAQLTPPQTLNPQSINQQLQQMYQQRMQMIQQAQPGAPAARQ